MSGITQTIKVILLSISCCFLENCGEFSETPIDTNDTGYEFCRLMKRDGYVRDSVFRDRSNHDRYYYKVFDREGYLAAEYYMLDGLYEDTFKVYFDGNTARVIVYRKGQVVYEKGQ